MSATTIDISLELLSNKIDNVIFTLIKIHSKSCENIVEWLRNLVLQSFAKSIAKNLLDIFDNIKNCFKSLILSILSKMKISNFYMNPQ